LVIDPVNGRIVEANSAACKFYGWSLAELIGKTIYEINTLQAEEVLGEMALAQSQQRSFFRFRHRLADGRVRDVETRSEPIPWNDRVCLCSIITDITDRKQAEEALRAARENLEQQVQAKIREFTIISGNKKGKNKNNVVLNKEISQSLFHQFEWPRTLHFDGYGDYRRFKDKVTEILAEVTGKPHSIYEVAVHEALANAMECRDGVPRQHKAILRFNKLGKWFIVRVKTSRMGFAGNAILRRLRSQPEDVFSFGEDTAMGRGIPLMLSISHRMTYNSDGTEVLLAWKMRAGTDTN
jgi:PAS domain S-box-containing protein